MGQAKAKQAGFVDAQVRSRRNSPMSIQDDQAMPVKCRLCDLFTFEPDGERLCYSCRTDLAAKNGECPRCGVYLDRANPKAKDSVNCVECEMRLRGASVEPEACEDYEGMAVTDGESPSYRDAMIDAGRGHLLS